MSTSNQNTPVARKYSVSIPWILFIFVATVGLSVALGRFAGHGFLLGILNIGVILVGSVLGIAVAWSTGCRSAFASIAGAAIGCALSFGCFAFFGTLLLPPEPGTRYKWGQGIDGATLAFMLAAPLGGGCCGAPLGALAALAWVLRKRSHGKDFVLLAMLFPEDASPDAKAPDDEVSRSRN